MAKVAMLDLASRVKSALKSPNAIPWFPELTDELARIGWDALDRDIGLTINDYSTSRVLSANACAPQSIIAHLPTFPSADGAKSTICIESLHTNLAHYYNEAGISFYTSAEIKDGKVLSCLKDAASILNRVPTLMTTIATLVRALHVIKPEDDDYDVSFSEPDIPFSVFVSVPKRRVPYDALRVAEAIVHEAMHLQLTLIELIVPLVNSTNGSYFSPWREDYRNARGILHALYVFKVIDGFLEQLSFINGNANIVTEYRLGRHNEISEQMCAVSSFRDCPDLTLEGIRFARNLFLQSAH